MTSDTTAYYDAHVHVHVKGFVDGNARVDAAFDGIVALAPASPRNILEIGCGIGYVTARMAQHWPQAQAVGVDTSEGSIGIARQLFESERVRFHAGRLEDADLGATFDLIVMMDSLEHIPPDARPALFGAIETLLRPDGRLFISVPTPEFLTWLRHNEPTRIQPVDEDVTPTLLESLARDLGRSLLAYRRLSVWRTNDYAHAVIGDGSIAPKPAASHTADGVRVSFLGRRRNAKARAAATAARRQLVLDRLGPDALPAQAMIGDQAQGH